MKTIIICIVFILGLVVGHFNALLMLDLPEGWTNITKEDNLKGYIKDGVLHLYFSNPDNSMIDADYFIDLTTKGIIIQTCNNNHIDTIPADSLDKFIAEDNM